MAHSIGKTIATLRKEKGWTQVELAEKLQVSDKAVSKWEKDDAFPSVEFFPVLAELFEVNIDYLMTGKEIEPKIITMSKAELCAKNDNPTLLNDIKIESKDENGKNIIDYIVQYESLKVFSAICDKHRKMLNKMDFKTLFKFSLIANRTDILSGDIIDCLYITSSGFKNQVKKAGIKNLFHVDKTSVRYMGNETSLFCITDDMIDIIVCDKRVSENTISYILSKHEYMTSVWFQVFPYIIHQSYLHNNDGLFNKCLSAATENNQYAYDHYCKYYACDFLISKASNTFGYVPHKLFELGLHGQVRILEKTIKLALERGDFELVDMFNDINFNIMNHYSQCNCYIASDDEIRVAKLKADKSVSSEELAIQSSLHNGILNIEEILATKNYDIIKKAVNTYPIIAFEIEYNRLLSIIQLLDKKNWRDLLQFSVDTNCSTLTQYVLARDFENCEKTLNRILNELTKKQHLLPDSDYIGINSKYLRLRSKNHIRFSSNNKAEEIMAHINACKKQILDDCARLYDKETKLSELTKEYFETELEKGNTEIVIIKLCVRLEAVLRCDYHYEGEFSEMLNKYCSQHGSEDDGWGYNVEANFVKYLHKLRKCRNNIVHSEKNGEVISNDEIKFCIDYICKMG